MKKYSVYGLVSAVKYLGTYEADNKFEAKKIAQEDLSVDYDVSLCHQCSKNLDVGKIYKIEIEED